MQKQDVYLVSALRTAVGKAPRGQFKHCRPDDLLAHVIEQALAQCPGLDQNLIEDVIIGCAMPEAEQGMNVARISALLAGLPQSTSGMTINRFCASGVQSIALAAQQIASGDADVMVAGGTESMSQVPMGGHKLTFSPRVYAEEEHLAIAFGMGITAEKVAKEWQISRDAQDEFALQSHQRALSAIESGFFAKEITPYSWQCSTPCLQTGKIQTQLQSIAQDEGPRPDTSFAGLAKLRPVFAAKGTVTAGNTSQMSDGAGAAVLVSEKILKQFNLTPLARFKAFAVAGVAPEQMGIGPVAAIPKALKQAGLSLAEIDWIELNEAFAAQSLAVMKELDLDPAKVNPQGGAIALGHPLGATGAIRTATLLHGLQRTGQRYGMVTMCIGTGMGAAAIFERV